MTTLSRKPLQRQHRKRPLVGTRRFAKSEGYSVDIVLIIVVHGPPAISDGCCRLASMSSRNAHGCPPCQGFSMLRTRNGANHNRDRRNDLVNEMLRFAKAFRPKTVMMENVPRLYHYKPFKNLCKGLRDLGYNVKVEIKDAARYGVPQRRRRLILLAGLGFEIPFAVEARYTRTVREAIGRLKEPGKRKDALHNIPEKKRSKRVIELIRDIPKDGGSRGDLPRDRQLDCHKRSSGFKDIYGRMAWDAVAPTITGGCFNPSKGRFLHPTKDRPSPCAKPPYFKAFHLDTALK
jgi:DNA (cytosine-5)-methyltransferase 1